MKTVKLTKEATADLLKTLLKRSPSQYGEYETIVAGILGDVHTRGDAALFEYTARYDKAAINRDNILVTEEEIREAYALTDPSLVDVIRKALVNIRAFHEKQKQNSWFTSSAEGIMLGQKIMPLERVGVYVPGGKAPLSSTVLMDAIPAVIADFLLGAVCLYLGYRSGRLGELKACKEDDPNFPRI